MSDMFHPRPAPTDHAQHDELLVVRYMARDGLSAEERALADRNLATCASCASLAADVGTISRAVAAAPVPARTRDFRLTIEQAERLRGSRFQRFLRRFTLPEAAILRPLAAGVMSIGLVLVIVGTVVPGARTELTTVVPASTSVESAPPQVTESEKAAGERAAGASAALEAEASSAEVARPDSQESDGQESDRLGQSTPERAARGSSKVQDAEPLADAVQTAPREELDAAAQRDTAAELDAAAAQLGATAPEDAAAQQDTATELDPDFRALPSAGPAAISEFAARVEAVPDAAPEGAPAPAQASDDVSAAEPHAPDLEAADEPTAEAAANVPDQAVDGLAGDVTHSGGSGVEPATVFLVVGSILLVGGLALVLLMLVARRSARDPLLR